MSVVLKTSSPHLLKICISNKRTELDSTKKTSFKPSPFGVKQFGMYTTGGKVTENVLLAVQPILFVTVRATEASPKPSKV